MLNSLIDYAELYVPKLSKSKELRLLEEAAIIEKDKNENWKFYESEFSEYFAKNFFCYCVGDSLYMYNQRLGVYEKLNSTSFGRVILAYLEIVAPKFKHRVKLNYIWEKVKYFADTKKDSMPNVNYIAFQNKTVDIISHKASSHSPNYYATNSIPHEYVKGADCPTFHAALDTIFCGDREVIDAFWEMAGYLLYYGNDYPLQKIFIFLGAGSNGKSLILDVLRYMLGKDNYASSA